VGIEHGTVLVLMEDQQYEVTTFRTESTYQDFRRPDEVTFVRSLKEDLKRRDFTINALALDSTGEIIDLFDKKFVIINDTNPTLGLTPPLHFIFSDSSGQSLIIEPRQGGLSIIKDSIGVMTNSPDYQWHETNLRNYLSFTPNQKESIELLGKTLKPFSQGSGTFGFPGDFTPPSRFVRTAYLKNYAEKPSNELAAITLCHHILESVSIPKGIVITEHGASDFTCYSAYMCSETLSYYFSTYGNQRIRKISLSESLKNEKEFKNFPIVNEEDILELN